MQDDAKRVNDLFDRAKDHNVVIEQRSLTNAELNALLVSTPAERPPVSSPPSPASSSPQTPPAAARGGSLATGASSSTQPEHFVVALVDRRYLYRSRSMVDTLLNLCFDNYVGHYVVLVGYDPAKDAYRVLDPALPADEPHLISAHDLNVARACHGTDEDLIIVPTGGQRLSVGSPRSVLTAAAASAAA